MSVLLATCADFPDGEEGGELLVTAFERRGVQARWARWDDATVDWAGGLVALRSTWDYDGRRQEFLAWARSVPDILHGAWVFGWNTDKAYLVALAEGGVPVVPTAVVGPEGLAGAVAAVLADAEACVVKPSVGAGGRGVEVVRRGDELPPTLLEAPEPGPQAGPWVVQPLVESVRTEGETSVFVLGGVAVSQARKVPGPDDIRVHEHRGGHTVAVPVDAEAADLAISAVEAASDLLERHLVYARVDMMRLPDGRLVLSELEATEPGLYLNVLPENADHFAEAVIPHL